MDFPEIIKTASTPSVRFLSGEHTLFIDGESYPENSFEIYTPVLKWLKHFVNVEKRLKLDMNVSYMNSSSTKCILDILDVLDEAHGVGAATSVIWRFDPENPRSRELAEEFSEEFDMPFDIVPYES